MLLSVWKKLGLPELISTRMTLELANRAICTPTEIARDVFLLVGKFTFPADFVIVDYESDPRVPLILGIPFFNEKVNTAKDQEIFDSGCSRHITGNKSYLTDYQEIDGGFVAFRGNAKGGKITGKGIENQMDRKVKKIRCDNGTEFKNRIINEFCKMKGIRREFSVARTPQQNGPKSSKNEVADDAGKKSTKIPRKENGVQDLAKEGRERTQRNEFESMFGQENNGNRNRMFTPVSATGSTYVNLSGSFLINAATLLNADLLTDPLMPDLEDTADLQYTRIFNGAYDDEVEGTVADFNNLELTTVCMRTRNSYFPNNSSATISRRRNKRRTPNIVEPKLHTIVKMADNRTMEELLQAPTEGYGEAIVIPEINADHFENKTNLLQLVQANPYHGFERENPHTHIYNFKRITSTLKFRDVPNDVTKLMMFPYSLEGNARVWYDKEPPNTFLTWEDLVNKFMNQFFPPSKTTHLKNEISRFTQRFEETFREPWERFKEMLRACPHHGFTELAQIGTFYKGLNDNDQDSLNDAAGGNLLNDRIDKLAHQISTLVDIFAKKIITPASVKAVEESCVTCGGNHAYYNCPNTDSNQPSVCVATGTYNQVAPQNRASNYMAPPGFAPGQMKAITTRSGVAYEGPSIPTPKKLVEQETEETSDKEQLNFQGSNAHIQPPVIPISEPDVPKTLPKPNLPYPLRLNDQKLRKKATNQMEKLFQIFQDLHFDISFVDALLLMTKFASTIKSLLTNKDKLFELAEIPLHENCSAMLLKKLPEKLGDPGKFLILCDFPGMDVCHALADLDASINIMPLSIWKKPSLPKLTPTRMTLELADRSITRLIGFAEDVFVKVGKFHFSTDFVVVDFEADPRVPLILGRLFLRLGCALIDVYREEITLREYAQEVLGYFSNSLGGSPTSTFEHILFDSSPSLTPFVESNFILEEIEAYLKDDSVSPKIDHADFDPKGDICLIENLLNDDPLQLPSMDLKEIIKAKSSIEEPPEVELKDLPSHLEYAYLEENDKLTVIISKGLKDEEKEALLNVLKSHKRAIALKITDIKGIDPRFCIHKILMEEDFKPSIQSQIRVHLKIHEDIKKEVDRAKVDVIAKLPHPTTVKGVKSFLGHAGFYRRFIQDFSKISRPMTHLIEKETPFVFSKDCIDAFETLKKKLTEASILVVPDWNQPFELMCDASDFAIDAVLGQHKLDDALWAFRTAFKNPIGCTPYKLVYMKSFHLPIELEHKAYWALKHANFDLKTTGDHRNPQLNELNELCNQTYENSLIYKERTKKLHDSKIKNRIFTVERTKKLHDSKIKNRIFNVGDRVLLFNSRLKIFSGKLKTRWPGPFTIIKVFPYGTVELSQPDGPNFKVNGHRVKHYFGGDVPQLVIPDLQTFSMDK
nr:reverse transcriptase domain-containing protein [Tanacetum cinerariifolium]